MHVTKKGDAILIYVFHTQDVESHQHEMLLQYKLKNTRMCLRKRILTPCWNINHIIVQLIYKKEHNILLDPSTICHKVNL
jgi:hypothetical protein